MIEGAFEGPYSTLPWANSPDFEPPEFPEDESEVEVEVESESWLPATRLSGVPSFLRPSCSVGL